MMRKIDPGSSSNHHFYASLEKKSNITVYMKVLFSIQRTSWQLFILLLLIAIGGLLSSLFGLGLFQLIYGTSIGMEQHPDMMRLFQFITAVGTFLLPALIMARLCSNQPKAYLGLNGIPNGRLVMPVIAGMILLNPVICLTSMLNESMQLPTWAAPIENWMRQQEDTALHFTKLLIEGGGICPLFSNLIVIALTAAVCEEFLFRGTLQQIIGRCTTNQHVIVWICAILFSAFHLQFYGFIPRMILGAYFGYLIIWTRNIWLPVLAHFFNNAVSVIAMSDSEWKDSEWVSGKIPDAHLWPYIGIATLALIGFFCIIRYIRKLSINPEK